MNYWTLLVIGLGPMMSGLAAIYGEWNRRHIQQLRQDVNGQTHALVQVTHALGVSEGVIATQAAAFDRGDIKGTT